MGLGVLLMGEPRQVRNNGVLVWQATKVVTETVFVEHPDGSRDEVKKKVRLRGTAPTKNLARQRLDDNYKKYLVKTGELPVSALGLAPGAETVTVGDWLETWYRRREASGKVQASSLNRYRGLLDNHVLPAIGSKILRLFTLADVNKLMLETLPAKRRLRKNPVTKEFEETDEPLLGNSPLRKIQDILTQSMRMALTEKKITIDPMVGFERITKTGMTEEKKRLLGTFLALPRQITEFLYNKPDLGYWTLALIGMRQGERLGVEFSSFANLEDKSKPAELTIDRQLFYNERTKAFYIKHRTKTKASERILILPETVREALLLWKTQRDEWEKQGRKNGTWKPDKGFENLMFVNKNGTPIHHQADGKAFKALQVKMGLEPKAWVHSLRHMVATELGLQGVHPEVAKTVLGHNSVEMYAYYNHFNKEQTATPLMKVSEAFSAVAFEANDFFNGLMEGKYTLTPEQEKAWQSEYEDNPLYQKYFNSDDWEEEEAQVIDPDNPDAPRISEADLFRAVQDGRGKLG